MQKRSCIQVFSATVFAFMIRDVRRRFIKSANTNRSLGFFWIFIEPMLHVGLWMGAQFFMRTLPIQALSPAIFILTGAMPWRYVNNCISGYLNFSIIKNNQAMYIYRQVKPISIVISNQLLEVAIFVCIYSILLIICWWFNISWHLYHPLYLLINYLDFIFFVFGVSLILATLCFYIRFFQDAAYVFVAILYFISGVFFPITNIPSKYWPVFIYNPVFQMIEISRESFQNVSQHLCLAKPLYLFACALVINFIGLGLYFGLRIRIMTEVYQR